MSIRQGLIFIADATSEIPLAGQAPGDLWYCAATGLTYRADAAGAIDTNSPFGQGGGGGASTFTDFTKDLGVSKMAGTFDITGLSGLTTGKNVLVMQTNQMISSKGNARDEPEMDKIQASGYVLNSTTIRCNWNATGVVVGTYAFAYMIGA